MRPAPDTSALKIYFPSRFRIIKAILRNAFQNKGIYIVNKTYDDNVHFAAKFELSTK